MSVAQQLFNLGLVPSSRPRFDPSPAGTVIGTDPPAGRSLAIGSRVVLVVSAGYPEVSYDDGTTIYLAAGWNGQRKEQLAASSRLSYEASWRDDGSLLVYVQGGQDTGQLMLVAGNQPGAEPVALTAQVSHDRDPQFAPPPHLNVLAFIDRSQGFGRLCFATVGLITPIKDSCTSHPGFDLGRQISWSRDGSAILVFGSQINDKAVHGLIEFKTSQPFATNAAAWGQGVLVTAPDLDVIAGAYSPDGTQIALVSNWGGAGYSLWLATLSGLATPTSWRAYGTPACQVSWRSDSQAVAVMETVEGCDTPGARGGIRRIDLNNPEPAPLVATNAENPAWQPLPNGF
jgi:hypothetical protein